MTGSSALRLIVVVLTITALTAPPVQARAAEGASRGIVPAAVGRGQGPDVTRMVGPVDQRANLNDLPYHPPSKDEGQFRLTRHSLDTSRQDSAQPTASDQIAPSGYLRSSEMPDPVSTFPGMTVSDGCGNCYPPDSEGDVGPNNYIESVNTAIRIYDKVGNVLAGPTTYNSFFAALGSSTACGNNQNQGDGMAMYDHVANRWLITDFAFAAFPGTSFYQCIGVSMTGDPVAGGWWLYAVQIDPANPTYLGDYPKLAVWADAYYLSVNLWSDFTTFRGVRILALNRAAMTSGAPASGVAFTINSADLGNQYSLLPATFRSGDPPPAGQDEWLMDVNSSAVAGMVENQVFVRRFHADFTTPANSYLGVGANHSPDGVVTVNGFVEAGTSATEAIVPNGTLSTSQYLDSLGDKLMFPLVYQRRNGVESIYASQTVNNNQNGTGPTAIRWYQFNMTGNSIPATPTQQQSFNNGGDGIWRWMPSINVDVRGDVAIGYSASSTTLDPGIRYAGRLATDPASTLAQGEAVLIAGGGHQTGTAGRWGDYSATFVDPSDGCTFYHTNEYYSATSTASWNTRIGLFRFPTCGASTITSVSPNVGPTGGGQTVTITGTNFSGVNWVSFGATAAASFTVNSPTKITAVSPAHAAGLVHVRVNTAAGTSAATAADSYTFTTAPTVTSISPVSGPTGGGQSVVINGYNFSSVNWVSFGGVVAPSFTVNSPAKITAVSPAHAAGVVHVRVNTAVGTSAATAADAYTFTTAPGITSISPRAGPPGGGQSVVINGFNFSSVHWVSFGGIAAPSFTVNSPTKITAVTPVAHAGAVVHVRVNTSVGTSAITNADKYAYEGTPTITLVSPAAGPAGGGQSVIISGTNLFGANWVSFGGSAASFTVNSPTQITVVTPAHAAATIHVRVNTPLGTSAATTADLYSFN